MVHYYRPVAVTQQEHVFGTASRCVFRLYCMYISDSRLNFHFLITWKIRTCRVLGSCFSPKFSLFSICIFAFPFHWLSLGSFVTLSKPPTTSCTFHQLFQAETTTIQPPWSWWLWMAMSYHSVCLRDIQLGETANKLPLRCQWHFKLGCLKSWILIFGSDFSFVCR